MCLVRLTLNVRRRGTHGVWKQRCTCSTQGCIVQAVDPSPFEQSSAAPETVRLAPRSPWDATPRPRRRWQPGRCLVRPARELNEQEGRNNENRTHGCCCLLAQGSCLWKSVSRIEGKSVSVVPGGGYCARDRHRSGDGPARRPRLCRRWFVFEQLLPRKLAPGRGLRLKLQDIPQGYRLHACLVGQYTAAVDGILGRQHLWGAEQVPRLWRHESKYRNGRMV